MGGGVPDGRTRSAVPAVPHIGRRAVTRDGQDGPQHTLQCDNLSYGQTARKFNRADLFWQTAGNCGTAKPRN